MKNTLLAFRTGLLDGWEQPWEITSGMTYDDLLCQSVWDYGANIGQFVGKLVSFHRYTWSGEKREKN